MEPTNIWTKSYQKVTPRIVLEASIVFDIGEQGDMYEGIISVYVKAKQFNLEPQEYHNALTFDTETKARQFINDCLEKWGFGYILYESIFKYDYPPKDLLEIESIRKSYENSEE